MYGYVSDVSLIRNVTANTFDSTFEQTQQRRFTVGSGSGTFKINELVYEGRSSGAANASGFVQSWSPTTNTLVLVDTTGSFKDGRIVFGVVSNAAYNLISSSEVTGQLAQISVTPDPSSANVDTAFGYDTSIIEFPDIT